MNLFIPFNGVKKAQDYYYLIEAEGKCTVKRFTRKLWLFCTFLNLLDKNRTYTVAVQKIKEVKL